MSMHIPHWLRCLTLLLGLLGLLPGSGQAANTLDDTPRIAVLSAFEGELALLLSRLETSQTYTVNGVTFTTGMLQGKPVVLFLSGVSMTNAAMNTQLVLDRFRITHLIFSGIAGGVNPALNIGDVTVAQQWGQYLEVLMARETAPGKFSPTPSLEGATLPNFGMLHPRPVDVRSAAHQGKESKFWFEADAHMLALARSVQSTALDACDAARKCLTHTPKLVVGGNGVSGQAFVDNRAFREYVFNTFEANVLDMESAATAMVAYSNGVPFIAFRSLSDLAGGGGAENEMDTFLSIAADNSARVLLAFLAAWK